MRRSAILIMGLLLGSGAIASSAEPASSAEAAKPAQRIRQLEQRIRKLERELKAARAESSSARYQMQVVEGRVIVLDTQTGEARVIDPNDDGSKQRVEIGKSWITVTVLVNATKETTRQQHRPNNSP